jgi:N-acetylmuramoyl-L-alanine amidase
MRFQPYYLSNSWKVWGDTVYDYISLQLDEKLPYHSFQQINPSRIVVDYFELLRIQIGSLNLRR